MYICIRMEKKRFILIIVFLWAYLMISAQSNTISYAEALFEQGEEYYYEQHNYIKAKEVYGSALNVLEKEKCTTLLLYYQLLEQLADIANEEGDYFTAVRYMEKAISINNDTVKQYVKKDEGVYTPYRKLSDYYAQAGLWDKAIQMKQNRIVQKMSGDISQDVDFGLSFEDYMYWVQNTYYYKYALRIVKGLQEKHGGAHYNYWLGMCYFHLRDYDKALSFFKRANSDYGLAMVYAAKGDFTKALTLQKKVVEDEKEAKKHTIYISGHEPLPEYVSILAHYYIKAGQYDKAIVCEHENNPSVLSYLNLSRAYAGIHQWDEAKRYASKVCQMHPQEKFLSQALMALSEYSYKTQNYDELEQTVSSLMVSATKELLSTFNELTYDERSRYIDDYSNLLNNQIPQYAYYTDSDSLIAAAYNASLMIKGALLSSENGVKRVIEDSRDASLMDLWEELRAERYILSKCLEKGSLETKHNIDSLQRVINKMEDSLIVRCKEYGDITQSMKLKWQDVQRSLHPEDIAIELLSFPINNDSLMYVALTLRKDSEIPKMTVLFEESQLKQISDTSYFQCKEMTDFVWRPLLSELIGIKNIYFSPTGALYNIGVEYLPQMEEYNIIRLSSTRELVINRKKPEFGKNAVLYGGLDYDATIDSLTRKKSLTVLNETFKEHADVRGLGLRGGKEYLEHTKIEVDKIGEELNKAKWACLLDTAALGTEESFKALSGRRINCLHLSTHGFYYTKEEADNAQYSFMLIDNQIGTTTEDKALRRSGLLLSGANHILEGDTLPDNVEDGILTAKEIADVDLRGLDLVVLSACQTGLGDISQGEGVFGLQRGFKKAGANTILMSLWEVNDEATQMLMTQFYKNLVAGMSKRKSLQLAQEYLRAYKNEKGEQCYNEPKYWAAFILLDANE